MAIISVRVVSDMPAQSRFMPYISIYFQLSLLFSLISFIWFIICEKCKTKKFLPIIIVKLIRFIKSKFINKIKPISKQNDEINYDDYVATLNKLVFLVVLILCLVANISLWILISE